MTLSSTVTFVKGLELVSCTADDVMLINVLDCDVARLGSDFILLVSSSVSVITTSDLNGNGSNIVLWIV